MSRDVAESERYADEAASNPELVAQELDRIVELAGHESAGDLSQELATRENAATALADLATNHQCQERVAEYNGAIVDVLEEEATREFAEVSTIGSDVAGWSRDIQARLLRVLTRTVTENPDPLCDDHVVSFLVGLEGSPKLETRILYVLRIVAGVDPGLLVPHADHIRTKGKSDTDTWRLEAFQITNKLLTSDHETPVGSRLEEELSTSILGRRDAPEQERVAAGNALTTLARLDPERMSHPIETYLEAAPEAPDDVANRLCYIVEKLADAHPTEFRAVLPTVEEQLDDVPEQGRAHLLSACEAFATAEPDPVLPVTKQSFGYLDSSESNLTREASDLIVTACIPDHLDLVRGHDEQIVELLSATDGTQRKAAAAVVNRVTDEDTTVFDHHTHRIRAATDNGDDMFQTLLLDALTTLTHKAETSPLFQVNETATDVSDFQRDAARIGRVMDQTAPPILQNGGIDLDPLEETVQTVCNVGSDAEEGTNTDRLGVMFVGHCLRNPDRVAERLDEILVALRTANADRMETIVAGLQLLCAERPGTIEPVLAETGDVILEREFDTPLLRVVFLQTLADERGDAVDRLLVDNAETIRTRIDGLHPDVRIYYLMLLGKRTNSNPRTGLRFLEFFSKSILPERNPPMTEIAVHNVEDIVGDYPRIVAEYADQIARALETEDITARRRACRTLAEASNAAGFDVAEVCRPYVVEIVSLFDSEDGRIRRDALRLFRHIVRSDPETGEEYLTRVIDHLYHEDVGVQTGSMLTLAEAVRNEDDATLHEVSEHVDRILSVFEQGIPPLSNVSLHVLSYVCYVRQTPLLRANVVDRIEEILAEPHELEADDDSSVERESVMRSAAVLFAVLDRATENEPLDEWARETVRSHLGAEDVERLEGVAPTPLPEDTTDHTSENDDGETVDPDQDTEADRTDQQRIEALDRDSAVAEILEALDAVRSDDPAEINRGLKLLGGFVTTDKKELLAPAASTVARCLPNADLDGKERALMLLAGLDYRWLPHAEDHLDAVDDVLRRSEESVPLQAAIGCVFPLPGFGAEDEVAPLLESISTAVAGVDSPKAVRQAVGLQSTVMGRDDASPEAHARIIAAGLGVRPAAALSSNVLVGFDSRFETVPETLLTAALDVVRSPHGHDQSTLARVLQFLRDVEHTDPDRVAAEVEHVSYILSERFATDEPVDVRATETLHSRSIDSEFKDQFTTALPALGTALSAERTYIVELAAATIGNITNGGSVDIGGIIPELLEALGRDIRRESRRGLVRSLLRHISDDEGTLEPGAVEDVVPHTDAICDRLESADSDLVVDGLLNLVGGVAVTRPEVVEPHVETLLAELQPDPGELRHIALKPLPNLVDRRPEPFVAELDAIVSATLEADEASQVRAGVRTLTKLERYDAEAVAPHLARIQRLVGETQYDHDLGVFTRRILSTVPESVPAGQIDAVLDTIGTTSSEEYLTRAAGGVFEFANHSPAPYVSHVDRLLSIARQVNDLSAEASNLLVGTVGQVAKDHPDEVVPYLGDVADLIDALQPGLLQGYADVFRYVARSEPDAAKSVLGAFTPILREGDGSEVAQLLRGFDHVATASPGAVAPYIDDITDRTGDDTAEVRRTAFSLLATLADQRVEAVSTHADPIRQHLDDDSGVAREATRCLGTLYDRGYAIPTDVDVERLVARTDDADLAEARMRAVWEAAKADQAVVGSYADPLRDWSRRSESTPGVLATNTLTHLPRARASDSGPRTGSAD
jgi:hypothetical protein